MASAPAKTSAWRRVRTSLVWQMLREQRRWAIGMLFAMALSAGALFPAAQVQATMIDKGIVEQSVPLEPFVVLIVIIAVIVAVVQFGAGMVAQRVVFHLEYGLRTRLYRAIQGADLQRLDRMTNGQLITRSITDLHMIERFLAFVPFFIGLVPLMAGLTIYVMVVAPAMAILSLVSLPVNIWLLRRFSDRLKGLSWAELNERAEVTTAIDEPVRGIRVVRAFGREEHERQRVESVAHRAYRYGMTRWRLLARFDVPMKIVPILSQAAILLAGAYLLAEGSLSTGTFVIAFQLATGTTQLAQIFDNLASYWQYFVTAQNRLDEVLAMDEGRHSFRAPLPPPSTGLEVRDVSLDLAGRRVLDGVSLEAGPGELVVVTGSPGSGKSTLAAIAAGIVPPDVGDVRLDGVHIASLGLNGYEAVRVVSEDAYTFATTVRENLQLGIDGEADEDTLRRALWAAGADDFVDDLAQGLDTHLGERGLTLSGGQRQRLALARALVDPPRVLVLDDALSAVNPSLEVEVLRRIRQHAPDTAIVCISRRRGATTIADRVVTLPEPSDAPPAIELALEGEHAPTPEIEVPPQLVDIVRRLELSSDEPGVPDQVATADRPPRVKELLSTFRGVVTVAVIILLVQSLARFAPEIFVGNVTELAQDGKTDAIPPRALALVGLGAVAAWAAYVFRIWTQRFDLGSMYLLRRRMFQRLSKLGIDFYDRELPGEVASKVVYDLDTVSNFMHQGAFEAIQMFARVLVGISLVLVLSPSTSPVFIGLAIVVGIVSTLQLKVLDRVYERARDALGTVVSKFEEDATASHDIRSFGAVERQTARFEVAAWHLRTQRKTAAIAATAFTAATNAIGTIAAGFVLYQAGGEVLAGAIGVGSAVTLRLLVTEATQPFMFIGRLYDGFLRTRVSFRRLSKPWDVEILPVEATNPVPFPDTLEGAVAFEDIRFAYPHTGREVLHDVTFQLPPGSVTTLVGYTGAGKSSIAKLLSRTYDPDQGRVTIDGIDLRELDLSTYRPRIGVVPQDAFLFKGTIASNIAYGRLEATREDIEEAARAVGADGVLARLPGGYDHPVDEDATNLTAAQRQLIALARAWIANPALLVLDEATSCLDAKLEQKVLDAVHRLSCTTLMVTHRDNVAARSDHVVVLEAGVVVEEGSPSELIGAGGAYDRLWVLVDETDRTTAEAPIVPVPEAAAATSTSS